MVPAAELRVYQPLEAFPPHEQAHWERHIVDGALRVGRRHHRQDVTAGGSGILVAAGEDGAHVKVVDGAYYVCPWRTRLRVLAAIVSFRQTSTFDDPSMFVTDEHRRRARKELRRIRRKDPNLISAIMHSPWHVPVRWFVLFEDHERRLIEHDGHHRLSYLTTARRALVRAEEVVPPLRRSELGPIADLIVDLHQWISLFDANSILELDYAGLSGLMTWDEMDDDHSARDLHEAIRALSEQRFPRSAELYQAVLTRSAELRSHEGLN